MPLLDHFRQPHSDDLPWDSFSTMWVATLTGHVNRALPRPRFRAFADRPSPSKVEVRVVDRKDAGRLVAVIRFVCPDDKLDSNARAVFVDEIQLLLKRQIGLVVVDIVTQPEGNLHDALMDRLQAGPPITEPMYCATYRATADADRNRLEVWALPLQVGQKLPAMPLPLVGPTMIPLDLDAAYEMAVKQSGS